MDVTAAVFEAVTLFHFAMVLVNIILVGSVIWLLLEVVKSALQLYDYFKARRKISRGYGARRLAALAALEGGEKDG